MLIASVSLWRKYHPKHKTVLYVDDMTNEVLENLQVRELWNNVRQLKYPEKINKEVFWSGCKTKIISETKIPIVVVDHDFLIFKNIDAFFKDEIICTYDELASNWYPHSNDKWNRKLTNPIEHIIDRASNVSLFYLPDPIFAKKYGERTLLNHQEFTAMNVKEMTPNHMIYSEQFMIRQWIEKDSIPYKTLCKNIWDCKTMKYTSETWENGFWDLQEASIGFKHYGVEKRMILDNRKAYNYDDNVEYLYRCINAGRRLDMNLLRYNMKKIQNR